MDGQWEKDFPIPLQAADICGLMNTMVFSNFIQTDSAIPDALAFLLASQETALQVGQKARKKRRQKEALHLYFVRLKRGERA